MVRNGVEKGGGGAGGAAGDVAEHAPVGHGRPLRHPPRHAAAPEAEGLPHGASRARVDPGLGGSVGRRPTRGGRT